MSQGIEEVHYTILCNTFLSTSLSGCLNWEYELQENVIVDNYDELYTKMIAQILFWKPVTH